MMSDSNRADVMIKRILVHEGGFVDHPEDPGGATNLGVTLKNFRRFVKPKATVADLKVLTPDQAGVVYQRHYLDPVMADRLPLGVDWVTVDFAVNSGVYRSVTYLQKIVNTSVDGRVGPMTLAAVNAMDPAEIVNRMCDDRLAFLRRARNSDTGKLMWPTFGKGWSKRVERVRAEALGDF